MHPQRRNAVPLLLVALAVGACSEQTPPTAIPDGVNAAVTAAGPNNLTAKVKVKTMQLSANTLRIDGPSVTGQVSIGNSGLAIPEKVVVRAEITQGSASKQALNTPTQCSPASADSGKLPTGTCDMTFFASASNSAPGTDTPLAPGSATFTLHVVQTSDAGDTELASKSLLVNLVATPSIAALTIAPTTLTIEGPGATYSVTLQNPAKSLQGVLLQGYVVQGSTRRAAGGTLVTCNSSAGVLPTGSCSMSSLASASNNGISTPTLIPGAATFELYLLQNNNGVLTPLDTETVAITLDKPIIGTLSLASPTVEINGALDDYTVRIQNAAGPLSDVLLQGELVQSQPGGLGTTVTVTVAAGGTLVTCGGPPGYLPSGTCQMQSGFSASTSSAGNGTLQPGPAKFVLHLYKAPPNAAQYEWDMTSVDVELTSPAPTLTSVVPTSTNVVLSPPAGLATSYVATINNPGVARFIVTLQAEIKQGSAVRAAGGRNVTCGGNITLGVLPSGSCVQTVPISAFNSNGGIGTLVPGPATLEVSLNWFNGTTSVLLDKKTVDITLVTGVSITDISLEATDILVGGSTNYTVTFNNSFATTLSNLGIQGYLDQGSITSFGAGGTTVTCSGQPAGQLAPGTCTMSFTLNSRNVLDAPAWQPGPATFRLQLYQNNAVLDEKSVTVRFYILQ